MLILIHLLHQVLYTKTIQKAFLHTLDHQSN